MREYDFPHDRDGTLRRAYRSVSGWFSRWTVVKCENCETETNGGNLCSACEWLSKRGPISPRGTAGERLVNRRWQMRFARGELK